MGTVIMEDDGEAAELHKRLSAGEHIPLSSMSDEAKRLLGIPTASELSVMDFGTGDDIPAWTEDEKSRLSRALAKVFGWDQPIGFS